MTKRLPLPDWAMREIGRGEWEVAAAAYERGLLVIHSSRWGARRGEKKRLEPPLQWAKAQGWRLPWLSRLLDPLGTFLAATFASEERFEKALRWSGVVFFVPRQEYLVDDRTLGKLDALYAARDETGRPNRLGELVAELRDLRRAVEAGVEVVVEQGRLRNFSDFYTWAHGRYHMLEDGYDDWIGNDR